MGEETEEESFEELEDDFESDDIDEDDIDLAEIDDEDDVADFDAADEEAPPRRTGGGSSSKDDDDLLPSNYEQAVKANPKRQNKQLKQARTIEGLLDSAELGTDEGAAKAWVLLQSESGGVARRKYALKDEYTANDVIEHPSFGEGYVIEILSSTKMSVLFESGVRRLAHNRP